MTDFTPPEAVRVAWRDDAGTIVLKAVDPHTQTDFFLVPFHQWVSTRSDAAFLAAIRERGREIENGGHP